MFLYQKMRKNFSLNSLVTVGTLCLLTSGCYEELDNETPSPSPDPTFQPPSPTPLLDQDGDGSLAVDDCDDENPAIYPGATEVCDQADNNCDDQIDEGLAGHWYQDVDQDGYGGSVENTTDCAAPEGYVATGGDCDDSDNQINPGVTSDLCDNKDNDCDTAVDEDPNFTFYDDSDYDGYGDPSVVTMACVAPAHSVEVAGDCGPQSAAINPGEAEVADNGADENCDGIDWIPNLYVSPDGVSPVAGIPATTTITEAVTMAYSGHKIAVLPGTYREQINFAGKNLLLASTQGPEVTIVDGGGVATSDLIDSVFVFINGEGNQAPAIVRGFTIRNGRGTDGSICGYFPLFRYGGGVCSKGSAPTLEGNIIEDNSVYGSGAGLYLKQGNVDLIDNVIRHNYASYDAGGINLSESAGLIEGNLIVDNFANGDSAGIYAYGSSARIYNNVIAYNISQKVDNDLETPGVGAGLAIVDSYPYVFNNLFAFNEARDAEGGAIWVSNDSAGAEIVNNTFVGNAAATSGGGIRVIEGSVTLQNNIFAFNIAPNGANAIGLEQDDIVSSYNLYFSSDGVAGTVGFDRASSDLVANPLFVDGPDDFDESDDDYHLQPSSPAVDAGNPSSSYNDPDSSDNDMGMFGGPRGNNTLYTSMAEITPWMD